MQRSQRHEAEIAAVETAGVKRQYQGHAFRHRAPNTGRRKVPAFPVARAGMDRPKLQVVLRAAKDAVFFNQSDLLCDMAKKEDFVVMGRCADAILTNNRIPHISIFITAPLEQRVHRVMEVRGVENEKKARHLLTRLDKAHIKYYKYYTGRNWGKARNYDLCINSASYGIQGSVDLIMRMISQEK